MSREIRISIDDDEVFERMRRQKDEMDLSWEEALRRGLAESADNSDRSNQPLDPFAEDFGERLRERIHRESVPTTESREGTEPRAGQARSGSGRQRSGFDPFDPNSIGDFVRRQVAAAVPDDAIGGPTLDSELDRLAEAEDAQLTFPFLESEDAAIPLRVTLQTTGEGLDVEVVAVRRGKDTEAANRFPAEARQRIATALADGETATLSLQNGAETYDVVPTLSWDRTDNGTPTVGDVTIEDVVLT